MKTLSDKKHPDWKLHDPKIKGWYLHDDVKEFIKDLKDEIHKNWKFDKTNPTIQFIDKLAGDKLT